MPLLNDREIYAAVWHAFADLGRDHCVIGGAVALAESGGFSDQVGDNYASGHQPEDSPYRWDDGLMQVNSIHGFDRQRLLDDVLYNTACARNVWNRQGWPAWAAFKAGTFREFLPRIEAAADSFNDPPPEPIVPPFSRDDLVLLYLQMYGFERGVRIEPAGTDDTGRRLYALSMNP